MTEKTRSAVPCVGTDSVYDARTALAGIQNTWLYHREMDAARKLAESGTDDECRRELDRLERLCKSRLEAWRWSQ